MFVFHVGDVELILFAPVIMATPMFAVLRLDHDSSSIYPSALRMHCCTTATGSINNFDQL